MLNVNCSLFVILDPFDSAKVRNILQSIKHNSCLKVLMSTYKYLLVLYTKYFALFFLVISTIFSNFAPVINYN